MNFLIELIFSMIPDMYSLYQKTYQTSILAYLQQYLRKISNLYFLSNKQIPSLVCPGVSKTSKSLFPRWKTNPSSIPFISKSPIIDASIPGLLHNCILDGLPVNGKIPYVTADILFLNNRNCFFMCINH